MLNLIVTRGDLKPSLSWEPGLFHSVTQSACLVFMYYLLSLLCGISSLCPLHFLGSLAKVFLMCFLWGVSKWPSWHLRSPKGQPQRQVKAGNPHQVRPEASEWSGFTKKAEISKIWVKNQITSFDNKIVTLHYRLPIKKLFP